jgi:hypothetical protein
MGRNRLGAKTIFMAMCMAIVTQSFAAQPNVNLLVDKLAAKSITKGLPLDNHETMQSGNGRTKQRWSIVGAELAKFEIIGDIQSDADLVGWNCAEYDAAGNYASSVRDESFCRKLFVSVLRNVLTKPEAVANDLLIKAKKTSPQSAVLELGDLSIETDGEYYFIRRMSRM